MPGRTAHGRGPRRQRRARRRRRASRPCPAWREVIHVSQAVQAGVARMEAREHGGHDRARRARSAARDVRDHRRALLGGERGADRRRRPRRCARPAPPRSAAAPSSRAARRIPSRGSARRGSSCWRWRARETGLPIVTEAMDEEGAELVARGTPTCIQIGARNMQNYSLLRAAGRVGKPVLLKRGIAATITELLLARSTCWPRATTRSSCASAASAASTPTTRNLFDLTRHPGGAEAVAPADHRRSEPRHGAARQGDPDGAGRGRGGRRRHHGRGASRTRSARCPTARSRSIRSSSRSWWASSARSRRRSAGRSRRRRRSRRRAPNGTRRRRRGVRAGGVRSRAARAVRCSHARASGRRVRQDAHGEGELHPNRGQSAHRPRRGFQGGDAAAPAGPVLGELHAAGRRPHRVRRQGGVDLPAQHESRPGDQR